MTREQRETLVNDMNAVLSIEKEAVEEGKMEKAERCGSMFYGMERTLRTLGYKVVVNKETNTVSIEEQE